MTLYGCRVGFWIDHNFEYAYELFDQECILYEQVRSEKRSVQVLCKSAGCSRSYDRYCVTQWHYMGVELDFESTITLSMLMIFLIRSAFYMIKWGRRIDLCKRYANLLAVLGAMIDIVSHYDIIWVCSRIDHNFEYMHFLDFAIFKYALRVLPGGNQVDGLPPASS